MRVLIISLVLILSGCYDGKEETIGLYIETQSGLVSGTSFTCSCENHTLKTIEGFDVTENGNPVQCNQKLLQMSSMEAFTWNKPFMWDTANNDNFCTVTP